MDSNFNEDKEQEYEPFIYLSLNCDEELKKIWNLEKVTSLKVSGNYFVYCYHILICFSESLPRSNANNCKKVLFQGTFECSAQSSCKTM